MNPVVDFFRKHYFTIIAYIFIGMILGSLYGKYTNSQLECPADLVKVRLYNNDQIVCMGGPVVEPK